MTETPYQKREVDMIRTHLTEKFEELRQDLTGQNEAASVEMLSGFAAVNKRQDISNGRTSSLEKWQYSTMGAISVLMIVVTPLLGWALWVLFNIQNEVHNAVDDALSAYNIEP